MTTPRRRKPALGKGALGTWAFQGGYSDTESRLSHPRSRNEPTLANRWIVECMWTEHFSSSGIGKARWVKPTKVRTGLGKTDRPGS